MPLGIVEYGAFVPSTAQLIANAIGAMGLGMTGNIIYVDPVNGLDGNTGLSPVRDGSSSVGPVATLAKAYAIGRSGYNDVIVLIGNGASTGSARITTFTWAKNALHLVGVASPSAVSQRARIANPTTTGIIITANFFTLSGNGCLFQNLSFFQGAGAGQTGIAAAICMTVSGQRNAFVNCSFEGMGDTTASVSATSRSLKVSAGENAFYHCTIGLDTVARTNANASVEISGNAGRVLFEDCLFPINSSDGLQYAFLAAAASAFDRWVLFKRSNFIASGTATAQLMHAVASSGSSTGKICLDSGCGTYGVTALGDATSLTQIWVAGGTATTGTKGIVAG